MIGHRSEIELDGVEYVGWEDIDGWVGAIEIYMDPLPGNILDFHKEIWVRGQPITRDLKRIARAMGVRLPRHPRAGQARASITTPPNPSATQAQLGKSEELPL